ncbi:piggyBac transposable element-derived protein 4-like [Sycon ciliatum]|uniref:piggyBac transposable element-derived protein 4-like n=1 Tax=Sycon ciliatum TaxID=27933 RepID=UPI0031F5F5F5
MSRDRYSAILEFLHFADNTQPADAADKLRKVRPLIDLMNNMFRTSYKPKKEISIDEELVKFKGRVSFRQYIPSKRARFGVKIFALCDHKGYYWNSSIYLGKPLTPSPLTTELGVSGAVVVSLLRDLIGKGYHLYLDNFYNSLPLCEYLTDRNTSVCGTLRSNRVGIPKTLKDEDVPKGKFAYLRKGRMEIIKLHDRKMVYMISNIHNTDTTATGKRNRQRQRIHRLTINHNYNQYMGGVDKNDSMVAAHSGLRKSVKWYKKVGFHYLEEGLQNAFIIYKQLSHKIISHYGFLKEAASSLLSEAEQPAIAADTGNQDRLLGRHWPAEMPPTENNDRPRRRCRVCLSHGRRKDTTVMCETCHDKPPLCIGGCFKAYHTKKNY